MDFKGALKPPSHRVAAIVSAASLVASALEIRQQLRDQHMLTGIPWWVYMLVAIATAIWVFWPTKGAETENGHVANQNAVARVQAANASGSARINQSYVVQHNYGHSPEREAAKLMAEVRGLLHRRIREELSPSESLEITGDAKNWQLPHGKLYARNVHNAFKEYNQSLKARVEAVALELGDTEIPGIHAKDVPEWPTDLENIIMRLSVLSGEKYENGE